MNNSGDGIGTAASFTVLTNNTVVNAGGYGIHASGTLSALIDNQVDVTGGTGLIVSNGECSANNLVVTNVNGSGVFVDDAVLSVSNLLVSNVNGSGVLVYSSYIPFHVGSFSSLFVDTVVIENCKDYGIRVDKYYDSGWYNCKVENFTLVNSVIKNNGGGVYLSVGSGVGSNGYNYVENNTITDNGGDGLELSAKAGYGAISSIIRNNVVTNNSGDGICTAAGSADLSSNTVINAGGYGIHVIGAGNSTLTDNQVEKSFYGIYLDHSKADLSRNIMIDNRYNFGVWGSTLNHFMHRIDKTNTVNDRPIYYLLNASDLIADFPDAGYVAFVNSENVTVQNLALTNNIDGIVFAFTHDSGIRNLTTRNNLIGITLHRSTFNYAVGNNVSYNEIGLRVSESRLNFIYQNNFISNSESVSGSSDAYINSFDNVCSGGNYWSDHDCIGDPSDGSCVYLINGQGSLNRDRYPFQHPINLEVLKGDLRIRITDSAGNPVENVSVTASYYQLVSRLDLQGVTDSEGCVQFNGVVSGTYTMYAIADGFYPTIRTGSVAAGQANSENLSLLAKPQRYVCWGVIVGVATYRYIDKDAPFADFNALTLCNRLYPIWGKDHLLLLLNENATMQSINGTMASWLAPRENQDDRILIFFSGHGGNTTREYICPYDSYSGSMENAITDILLSDWLSVLDSQRITIILDSCYSGGFMPELSQAGRIVLAACRANETALACADLQHGLFTHYLIAGFIANDVDANKDGKIEWQELFSYAEPKVTAQALDYYEHEQHPVEHYGFSEDTVIVIPEFLQALPLLLALLLVTAFAILIRRRRERARA